MLTSRILSIGLPAVAVAAAGVLALTAARTTVVAEEVNIKPVPTSTTRIVALADDKKADDKEGKKVALPAGTGILKGKITFKGTPPKLPPVVMMGDPSVKDAMVCAAKDLPNDSILIGKNGGLANVAIYMMKAPSGFKPQPIPDEPVVLDQKNCQFFPKMHVVRVNQTILIKSDDPIAHNTHTVPLSAREFNQSIGANTRDGVKMTYDKPERNPVTVKCDIHPWMKAYHVVSDHGITAVTDEEGEFEIVGVPAGNIDFRLWHEVPGYLDKAKRTIKITAGKTTELNVEYTADNLKAK